jgi:hypothetical protein
MHSSLPKKEIEGRSSTNIWNGLALHVQQSGISIVKKHFYENPECSDSLSAAKGLLQEMVKRCTI